MTDDRHGDAVPRQMIGVVVVGGQLEIVRKCMRRAVSRAEMRRDRSCPDSPPGSPAGWTHLREYEAPRDVVETDLGALYLFATPIQPGALINAAHHRAASPFCGLDLC